MKLNLLCSCREKTIFKVFILERAVRVKLTLADRASCNELVVNQTVIYLVKSVQCASMKFCLTLTFSLLLIFCRPCCLQFWPLNCTNVVYIKRPPAQIIEHNTHLMLYQCCLPAHEISLHFVWFMIVTWSVSILLWQHDVFMTDNHLHIDIIAIFAGDNNVSCIGQ